MSEVSVDLPNINDVMTKAEQAKALFNFALSLLEIPKKQTKHSAKQENEAKAHVAHYFPELSMHL